MVGSVSLRLGMPCGVVKYYRRWSWPWGLFEEIMLMWFWRKVKRNGPILPEKQKTEEQLNFCFFSVCNLKHNSELSQDPIIVIPPLEWELVEHREMFFHLYTPFTPIHSDVQIMCVNFSIEFKWMKTGNYTIFSSKTKQEDVLKLKVILVYIWMKSLISQVIAKWKWKMKVGSLEKLKKLYSWKYFQILSY